MLSYDEYNRQSVLDAVWFNGVNLTIVHDYECGCLVIICDRPSTMKFWFPTSLHHNTKLIANHDMPYGCVSMLEIDPDGENSLGIRYCRTLLFVFCISAIIPHSARQSRSFSDDE